MREQRFRVDRVERFRTPQKFRAKAPVLVDVFVNGKKMKGTHHGGSIVWAGRGVMARAIPARKRGPIRFRVANFRKRDARVRVVYGRLGSPPPRRK